MAKSCEREALDGAVGRVGVGYGEGENLLFSKVSEGWMLKERLVEVMSL